MPLKPRWHKHVDRQGSVAQDSISRSIAPSDLHRCDVNRTRDAVAVMRRPAFPEDLVAAQCAWIRTYRALANPAARALTLPDGQAFRRSQGETVWREATRTVSVQLNAGFSYRSKDPPACGPRLQRPGEGERDDDQEREDFKRPGGVPSIRPGSAVPSATPRLLPHARTGRPASSASGGKDSLSPWSSRRGRQTFNPTRRSSCDRRSCTASLLTPHGARGRRAWACPLAMVEGPGQLAVGFSGGFQLCLSLFQGRRHVDVVLFHVGDLVLEFVDVGRGTQAGLAPDLLPPRRGQAFLQLLDACDQQAWARCESWWPNF